MQNDEESQEKTQLAQIRQILVQTKVEPAKSAVIVELFRRLFSTKSNQEKLEDVDCQQGGFHEIIPRLFLGDCRLAMDQMKLKQLGFTHILNAAEGRKFGQINTSATYYEDVGIKYIGFSILDVPTYNIGQHFPRAIQFIDDALTSKKNRVYVHCQQGISRSATLVVAYLVHAHDNLSLVDAFQLVATRRRIWPNDGFCRHLVRFEKEIRTTKTIESPPIELVETSLQACRISDVSDNDKESSTNDTNRYA